MPPKRGKRPRPESSRPPGASAGPKRGKPGRGLAALQERLRSRLAGSQFRWINEKLYSQKGDKSFSMFKEEPALFHSYHEGFREQVARWPVNPLDVLIRKVGALPKDVVVADMGCGEARLGEAVPQKVHSFDLVAANDSVTACDIASVPLPAASVDCVVFCLALMGTDYSTFLAEAARICRPGGQLMIAEVRSRVEGAGAEEEEDGGGGARRALSEGEAAAGVSMFVDSVQAAGFRVRRVNRKNKMFLLVMAERDEGGPGDGGRGEEEEEELTGAARRVAGKRKRKGKGKGKSADDGTAGAGERAPGGAEGVAKAEQGKRGGGDGASASRAGGAAASLRPCRYRRR